MSELKKASVILKILRKVLDVNQNWVVVDHWPDDLYAIGVAHKSNERRLVYISAFNKKEGMFDYQCEEPRGEAVDDYITVDSGEDIDQKRLSEAINRHLPS